MRTESLNPSLAKIIEVHVKNIITEAEKDCLNALPEKAETIRMMCMANKVNILVGQCHGKHLLEIPANLGTSATAVVEATIVHLKAVPKSSQEKD